MEERKLNKEKACQATARIDVLSSLCDIGPVYAQYRNKVDITTEGLFSCIDESIKELAGEGLTGDLLDYDWNGDIRDIIQRGEYLIDHAPYYEDNPDHISGHISKDLWKGYVMGYEMGRREATYRYRTDIGPFDPEYDNPDDCIIIPESEITDVFSNLEYEHDIIVKYLPDEEYEKFQRSRVEALKTTLSAYEKAGEAVNGDQDSPKKSAKDILEFAFGGEFEAVNGNQEG